MVAEWSRQPDDGHPNGVRAVHAELHVRHTEPADRYHDRPEP